MFSDPDHLTTDCTDDTDESDKIRCWWIRISCAARWSAATWGRFPHTTRNTQGPGFASRDHYKVNGYILTSSAVVGIDDAGIYSGGLKTPGGRSQIRVAAKEVKAGANESKRLRSPLHPHLYLLCRKSFPSVLAFLKWFQDSSLRGGEMDNFLFAAA
jgi:hypothetical protein